MNGYINAKTYLNKLQFGENACWSKEQVFPDLYVDNRDLRKTNEIFTNVENLVDEESGMSKLSPSESEKYLGNINSCDGNFFEEYLIQKIKRGIFGPYIF
jgi:hypothetical protein